ncbi:transglutaminase-like cysteine peptidase [Shewanella sp. JNE10-2]|uniref:transglutaminase-like cysteine peptidase n=1 Tax=unclassified Shewanella TaxID=196818 RepID=UPI002005EC26|nr:MULTISPECIES: transglutaminase-like cysteine peptidase [unclassified Shewanella]MCK7632034.1 transglutaminase-like cysteine peptidase [Shewanella sp. JNE9-1]MCK7647220.1 transglutaminase-like cysteine peptidase [Shewanella sp. JNE3-1]MCK7655333.1 transglutaminase-like cysteine peptidase [Shewanella sp. JNE4-1]UPO29137.1 transglutaminase-like cysteine peptidase [Shewanella sp. JNE10-2]UPO37432.1 transglutaminase-like cysteine peptidase [Shewanella sp. JNE7]
MNGRLDYKDSLLRVCRFSLIASALGICCLYAAPTQTLDETKIISTLVKHYGERAGMRAKAWFKVLSEASTLDEKEKLLKVNNFFNLFRFVDDIKLWGESNYWATPMEFIGVNGGDCEDFSIAKYFTLLQLGVPEDKMRITMVKATSVNQYHMVLAYYETPSAVPLVLDNLDHEIKPATKRKDLLPVYSFNGKQLWLNKEQGRGVLAGSSTRLEKWNDLNHRLGVDRLRQPKLKLE